MLEFRVTGKIFRFLAFLSFLEERPNGYGIEASCSNVVCRNDVVGMLAEVDFVLGRLVW